jgi:hypothetical protein
MRHGLIQEVTEAIENELSAANKAFPGFNSTHEGYAVILEEAQKAEDELRNVARNLQALWVEVKENAGKEDLEVVAAGVEASAQALAAEAIQTAAMARKLLNYLESVKE